MVGEVNGEMLKIEKKKKKGDQEEGVLVNVCNLIQSDRLAGHGYSPTGALFSRVGFVLIHSIVSM